MDSLCCATTCLRWLHPRQLLGNGSITHAISSCPHHAAAPAILLMLFKIAILLLDSFTQRPRQRGSLFLSPAKSCRCWDCNISPESRSLHILSLLDPIRSTSSRHRPGCPDSPCSLAGVHTTHPFRTKSNSGYGSDVPAALNF